MREQNPKNGVVKRVDYVVVPADLPSQRPVSANERVQRIAEHFSRASSHYLDFGNGDIHLWAVGEPDRALCDVDGVVPNSLEVIRYFDGSDNEPEVSRHRLLQSQQLHRCLLDFNFQPVEIHVALYDQVCLLAVAIEQRLHSQIGALLRLGGHCQQLLLQRAKLVVKMAEPGRGRGSSFCHPNLPVMYASVRSSLGRVKIWSVAPNSTSSPMKKNAVWSDARAACCRLCVTMMIVNSCLSS